MLEQTVLKSCSPWKGPALEQFLKNCPMRKTHAEVVNEGLKPMEQTQAGAGEKCEEERAAET